MIYRLVFILSLFIFSNFRLFAQISEGGIPPSFDYPSKLKSGLVTYFVNPPDINKLKSEDSLNVRHNAPYRIAENLPSDINILYNGHWDTLASGEKIWQLKIYSPGAQGLRIIYNDFYLPKGGKLFLYNETHDFIIGAFTEQNNHSSGVFATEIIPGETSILEYVAPKNSELPRININQIGYIYRGIDDLIPPGSRKKSSGSCEVNVNCSPEGDNWKDEKRAVTKIILDKYLCSGTLLNNTARDFKAYISTAFHCIDSIENTAATWIFYFNYERSGCSNLTTFVSYNTLVGAYIRARIPLDKGGDGALLQIFGKIPDNYNAFWAGWDRTNNLVSGGAGIHHPAGDAKKISICTSNWYTTTWHGSNNTNGAKGAHWSLIFAQTANGHGVTEGGSSGSPIFGPDELFRGSLSGGLSDCTNPNYDNLYGKLYFNWDHYGIDSLSSFKPWLDPINTGETRIPGIDKNNTSAIKPYWTSTGPVVNIDSALQFKDESIGDGYTRTWYFEGGTPSTSTEKEPKVYYANPGIYDVKLEIVKDGITYTKTRVDYAIIQPRPAWILQNTGFAEPGYGISGIRIVDSLTVWAWAVDFYDPQKPSTAFTRTQNGGITWMADTINYPSSAGYGIANIFPLNKDTAYVAAFAPSSIGGGKILKTSDGGKTWQHQTTALFSAPDGFPNWIHIFNAQQGVCMGDPNGGYFEVYTTDNSGVTWTRVPSSKIPASFSGEYGTTNYYDAKGDTVWFGTTSGRIFRSVDKGKNWKAFVTSLSGATDVKFKNNLIGFAIKKDAPFTMLKTTDGGSSWSNYSLPQNFLQGEIANVPGTKSSWVTVLFNDPSGSSYTLDNGASYNILDVGVPYSSVAFYNAQIGWAGSFNIDSVTGGIYKWNYNNRLLTYVPQVSGLSVNKPVVFKVFPNPVTESLNIQYLGQNTLNTEIKLLSVQGEMIWSKEFKFFHGDLFTSKISSLSPGIYILNIIRRGVGKDILFNSKIIKR